MFRTQLNTASFGIIYLKINEKNKWSFENKYGNILPLTLEILIWLIMKYYYDLLAGNYKQLNTSVITPHSRRAVVGLRRWVHMLQQPDRYRQTKFFLCYYILNLFGFTTRNSYWKKKQNMMAKWGMLCSWNKYIARFRQSS